MTMRAKRLDSIDGSFEATFLRCRARCHRRRGWPLDLRIPIDPFNLFRTTESQTIVCVFEAAMRKGLTPAFVHGYGNRKVSWNFESNFDKKGKNKKNKKNSPWLWQKPLRGARDQYSEGVGYPTTTQEAKICHNCTFFLWQHDVFSYHFQRFPHLDLLQRKRWGQKLLATEEKQGSLSRGWWVGSLALIVVSLSWAWRWSLWLRKTSYSLCPLFEKARA